MAGEIDKYTSTPVVASEAASIITFVAGDEHVLSVTVNGTNYTLNTNIALSNCIVYVNMTDGYILDNVVSDNTNVALIGEVGDNNFDITVPYDNNTATVTIYTKKEQNEEEVQTMTNIHTYPKDISIVEHGDVTTQFQPLATTYTSSIVKTQGTTITASYLHRQSTT